MEVVLGEMAGIIRQVQDCVLQLNGIYRQVLYITGVAPDPYRDYQIERSLPGLKAQLEQVQADLRKAIAALEKAAGHRSDKLTVLKTMDDQLTELIRDQERFTEVLSSYKTNVRACGNWITQVLGQPLQIDRIYLHTADVRPEITGTDFLSGAGFEASRLYSSFTIYGRRKPQEGTEDGPQDETRNPDRRFGADDSLPDDCPCHGSRDGRRNDSGSGDRCNGRQYPGGRERRTRMGGRFPAGGE